MNAPTKHEQRALAALLDQINDRHPNYQLRARWTGDLPDNPWIEVYEEADGHPLASSRSIITVASFMSDQRAKWGFTMPNRMIWNAEHGERPGPHPDATWS